MTNLVLIPGMMCDARLFGPQIDYFSNHMTLHMATITMHDNVNDLAKNILANAPPKFALLGLSMGGIVAMEILAQAPNRVEKIALLDTNPLAETKQVKQGREPIIQKVLDGQLSKVMTENLIPNYLHCKARRPDIENLCHDMALSLGSKVFEQQSRALQTRPDQTEILKKAQIKALILMGEDDKLCPIDRHQLMHELLVNSKLEIIKNAGHLTTLEQPDAVNKALATWLEN